jgi:integrase
MQVLSSIFTLALEKQLISSRPRTTMFRVSSERVRYLTPDEEKILFEQFDNCEWLNQIVLFALHTGMRRGEICKSAMVRSQFRSRSDSRSEYQEWEGPDHPDECYCAATARDAKNLTSSKSTAERGEREVLGSKPIRVSEYSFARAVKQAKITDLRFHDLRHTAATRMGDAGADAFTLAAIFGWSDIRMAMRYTHAMEDAKRRAVEAIAVGATRATRENAAIEISRDRSVTNEKRQALGSP